ncbi:MAG: response regulator [Nocardioidaceae bacterium]|nr:response regulator [Nocardioidaceae bacterium]MDQ3324299.1 response regulator [Actinomycetota bacterium]
MTRVVVADDDDDILELRFKLEQAGMDVEAVGDGVTALEACRRETPDLVLLDVMMPGMSGLDVCRTLRDDLGMGSVPVILLAARAQESDVDQGFHAGADDYVVKPFSPRELSSRVRAVLARVRR